MTQHHLFAVVSQMDGWGEKDAHRKPVCPLAEELSERPFIQIETEPDQYGSEQQYAEQKDDRPRNTTKLSQRVVQNRRTNGHTAALYLSEKIKLIPTGSGAASEIEP